MPYKVEMDGEKANVVNEETGQVRDTHEPPEAKEKAERQVRLLNDIEKDPAWDEEGEKE
jgi:hypothetical protein